MLLFSKANQQGFLALALVLSQATALSPLPVLAADGTVRVAGQAVIVNKTAAGGMSADQRTDAIQRNLDNALVAAKDRSPSAVNIVYVKGMPVITLNGYQVVTVDDANAKAAGTTPALLAKQWADSLRQVLTDQASLDSYVAQLSGDYQASAPAVLSQPPAASAPPTYMPPPGSYTLASGASPASYPSAGSNTYNAPGALSPPVQRGRVVYAPAGLTIPVMLATAISTQVAKPGDLIQASINQSVLLGDSSIPAGSMLVGQITDAKSGGFLGRSGLLSIRFNRLRTPDGVETPITAHIVGGIGKYSEIGSDESDMVKGETWKTKVGQAALRGAIGAGTGAALGTAIGAIAAHSGRGVGRGAWSGTAIGGGLGVAQSVLLRKGRDVQIPSGTSLQVQLDAPATISGAGVTPYSGAF